MKIALNIDCVLADFVKRQSLRELRRRSDPNRRSRHDAAPADNQSCAHTKVQRIQDLDELFDYIKTVIARQKTDCAEETVNNINRSEFRHTLCASAVKTSSKKTRNKPDE